MNQKSYLRTPKTYRKGQTYQYDLADEAAQEQRKSPEYKETVKKILQKLAD